MSNAETPVVERIEGIPDEYQEMVQAWKNQGVSVYFVVYGTDYYFFRPILRREWTEILEEQEKLAASGKLSGSKIQNSTEETICRRFLLHPKLDMSTVKDLSAGDVSSLSDAIMQASGFEQKAAPKKL